MLDNIIDKVGKWMNLMPYLPTPESKAVVLDAVTEIIEATGSDSPVENIDVNTDTAAADASPTVSAPLPPKYSGTMTLTKRQAALFMGISPQQPWKTIYGDVDFFKEVAGIECSGNENWTQSPLPKYEYSLDTGKYTDEELDLFFNEGVPPWLKVSAAAKLVQDLEGRKLSESGFRQRFHKEKSKLTADQLKEAGHQTFGTGGDIRFRRKDLIGSCLVRRRKQ